MKRRSFIRNTLLGSIIPPNYIKLFSGINGEDYPELKKHRIIRVERVKHSYHWPRHVGKNARKGNHGQYNSDDIFKLFTDQGAIGWALGRNKKDFSDQELNFLQGKLVSELISPEKGIRKDLSRYIDLALHDLMGVFAGHKHRNSIEVIKGKPQIVSDDNASGGYLDIDFLPLNEQHKKVI